jgi:arylsulfatase A-like enzyme
MIEHTDDALGKIIQKLKKEGLYDNTIILFSSDNGGLIGNNPKKRVTNNTPLRLGKGHIYEGGVRIPTIIKIPQSEYKGLTISTPIISTDYYPTLVDLAGISSEKTNAQTLDGNSLVRLFECEDTLKREALFWHYPHYHQQGGVPYSAVRKGNWKLIQNFDSNSYELYDLKNDIGEKENLYEKRAEIALNLKETLDNWRDDVAAQLPTINENYNPKKKWKKQ